MELRRKEWVGSFGSFKVRDLGDLLITDWECPHTEGVRGNSFTRRDEDALLPLSRFDTGNRVPSCLFIDAAQNALANILQDFLMGIDGQFARMTSVEIETARNAMLTLIAGMLRASEFPDVGDGELLPLLRRQLETWIMNHLSDGAVRVRDLAAAHNVAPRTVHRAFEATGTPSDP